MTDYGRPSGRPPAHEGPHIAGLSPATPVAPVAPVAPVTVWSPGGGGVTFFRAPDKDSLECVMDNVAVAFGAAKNFTFENNTGHIVKLMISEDPEAVTVQGHDRDLNLGGLNIGLKATTKLGARGGAREAIRADLGPHRTSSFPLKSSTIFVRAGFYKGVPGQVQVFWAPRSFEWQPGATISIMPHHDLSSNQVFMGIEPDAPLASAASHGYGAKSTTKEPRKNMPDKMHNMPPGHQPGGVSPAGRRYVAGQKVQIFSQSRGEWMNGTVQRVQACGTVVVHGVNSAGQSGTKAIPPSHQPSLLRPHYDPRYPQCKMPPYDETSPGRPVIANPFVAVEAWVSSLLAHVTADEEAE